MSEAYLRKIYHVHLMNSNFRGRGCLDLPTVILYYTVKYFRTSINWLLHHINFSKSIVVAHQTHLTSENERRKIYEDNRGVLAMISTLY